MCVCVCVHQPSPPGPVSIPGGGVPLNMKEVEELERMTQDFMKNMDKHPPLITSPPTGTHTHTHILTSWSLFIFFKLLYCNCIDLERFFS